MHTQITGASLDAIGAVAVLFLASIGLWLSYGMLRIINLAHGDMLMMGAYVTSFTTQLGIPFYLSVLMSGLALGLIGFLVERAVLRRLYARNDFSSLLASWGLSLLFCEGIRTLFGPSGRFVDTPISGVLFFNGASWPTYNALLTIIAIATLIVFCWVMYFTRIGLIIRATIEDPRKAERVGLDAKSIRRWVFISSCMITGMAGALLGPLGAISPYMGTDYTVRSFLAVITGGMAAVTAPVTGSLLVAGVHSILTSAFGYTVSIVAIYALVLLVIYWRPNGLSVKS
jgi:urea transport system permease protein